MNARELLPALRDLYSRHPATRGLEAYHLAWILFALGYTNVLEGEGEIAAAADVARQDWPEWWRAA
jgi:hypothetical protein